MKIALFVFDVIFAIAWLAFAIAAFAGYTMPPVTIGCGFLLASLYNVREAIENWFDWRH